MKKVVITTHTIWKLSSGWEKAVFNYVMHELKDSKLHLILPENDVFHNKKEWLYIHNRINKWLLKFLWFWRLCKTYALIKKEGIDELIINYPRSVPIGFILKLLLGVKLILYEHNIEYLRMKETKKRRRRILYPYEYLCYKLCDQIQFISEVDMIIAKKTLWLGNKWIVKQFMVDKTIYNDTWRKECNLLLHSQHSIPDDHSIILFVWAMDYYPNIEAVDIIMNEIYPELKKEANNKFTIIICWKNPPKEYSNKYNDVIFTWFVDDIVIYFKWCDIFINPIVSGGGVKTKLIEAIECGAYCISTEKGAEGIPKKLIKKLSLIIHITIELIELLRNKW